MRRSAEDLGTSPQLGPEIVGSLGLQGGGRELTQKLTWFFFILIVNCKLLRCISLCLERMDANANPREYGVAGPKIWSGGDTNINDPNVSAFYVHLCILLLRSNAVIAFSLKSEAHTINLRHTQVLYILWHSGTDPINLAMDRCYCLNGSIVFVFIHSNIHS